MRLHNTVSDALAARMEQEKADGSFLKLATPDAAALRRFDVPEDKGTIWRPAFVRDIDKIMHCPFYNRYADKTQVFSFYKSDDITHRGLHVQLVSRIARTIGAALNLNTDLIEAMALGHDIGHTPFGHGGEKALDTLYNAHTGRHFSHNIQSVRVLDKIYPYNLSLQTLSGIAGHDGETEREEMHPLPLTGFADFDARIEAATMDKHHMAGVAPSTLEGCVVRYADLLAYIGKDRQDAERAGMVSMDTFYHGTIGSNNSEIINNLMVNIIENSYGKPYIKMDAEHFDALRRAKNENYAMIYEYRDRTSNLKDIILPLMSDIYETLLADLVAGKKDSPIFTGHIDYVNWSHPQGTAPYEIDEPNQIVVDYIASMTDDYFVDLYRHLFPGREPDIQYVGYFETEVPDRH